jgi:hypothetical protein
MTKKYLTFKKAKPGEYEVYYENRVFMGHLLMKEDGFYDFWPDLKGGYWSAHILREIADKLDEINAPYERELEEFFEKQKGEEINDYHEYLGSD